MIETKNARAIAVQYAEKYGIHYIYVFNVAIDLLSSDPPHLNYFAARLRQEHDNHIQRLITKLSEEQDARMKLEEVLEDTQVNYLLYLSKFTSFFLFFQKRLWSQPGQSDADKAKQNFFDKIFKPPGQELKSSQALFQKFVTPHSTCLSHSVLCRRERDLYRELEKQQARITQLSAAMESNKEAQRIVLDTKESVLRSLLKQNANVTEEVSPGDFLCFCF